MEKAVFGGEYIVKKENVSRPTVTVNRTGKGLATNERDLIVCGCCGSVMSSKASFCMGCGAKFKKIKSIDEYRGFEALMNRQIDGQMSIKDLEAQNG